jgi:hypothetical protein
MVYEYSFAAKKINGHWITVNETNIDRVIFKLQQEAPEILEAPADKDLILEKIDGELIRFIPLKKYLQIN